MRQFVSRRSFLACVAAMPAFASKPRYLSLKLVKEFKEARVLSVSPDSQLLSLCLSPEAIGTFTVRGKSDPKSVSQGSPGSEVLKVLGMGTWEEIYSTRLQGHVWGVSFFPDGERLYAESASLDTSRNFRTLISLRTHSVEMRESPHENDPKAFISLQAFRDDLLIGIRGGTHSGKHELIQVEWTSQREVANTAVNGQVGGFRLSGNRKALVHTVDQWLVCRSSGDFNTLWKRQIDAQIDLLARDPRWKDPSKAPHLASAAYSISADGRKAVVAPRGGDPLRYYIEVFNGADGAALARWPMDFHDSIVLSPDGRFLAIGESVRKDGYYDPTVHLLEIPSGQEIATVIHDHIPPSRQQVLESSLIAGIQFTPDGKYLITSANNRVKVWEFPISIVD